MRRREEAIAASRLAWDGANRHYLDLQLRRLRLLLERRVLWLRSQWHHDPRQETAAQVISDAHADWLLRVEDVAAETRFYASAAQAVTVGAQLRAAEADIEALVQSMGERAPALLVLAHSYRLSAFERDVLLLCLAPELDSTFGPLYAYAQDDMLRPWPTMHLALALAGGETVDRLQLRELFSETAPLRRRHLVHVANSASPGMAVMARVLSLDERIADYLCGNNRLDERIAAALRVLQPGPLTAGQEALASQISGALRTARTRKDPWPIVNLTGASDCGQREIAVAIGGQLQVNLLQVDLQRLTRLGNGDSLISLLEREALLLQTAFYVEASDDAAHDGSVPLLLDDLMQHRQWLLIVASEEPVRDKAAWVIRLPHPEVGDSLTLWQQALGTDAGQVQTLLPLLVEQFNFGGQNIARAVTQARQQAQLQGKPLTPSVLWSASRDTAVAELDELAQRIEPYYTWRDLVVTPDVRRQLDEIAAQVAHRYQVYEEWGYGPSLHRGRGISALFSGPSGTGKTMAAEVLANHLDLALYRIDLASIVNKYIGETEKNIRRVFDAAERSGAILFFDEADALFGKRTEVKDSHDRFANIEINYLLQRMEAYRGLAILATNRRAALDRAFLRRLRFVVEFGFPDAEHRRRIWQNAFPPGIPLEGIDYVRLARLEIAGGNIRNVALNAAFLAAADGGRVRMEHLLHAARREYAKIDKLESDVEFGEDRRRA